jgi:hypothetical protein
MEATLLDKGAVLLVSIGTDCVMISVPVLSSGDEPTVLSIATERVVVVTELVILSVSPDD